MPTTNSNTAEIIRFPVELARETVRQLDQRFPFQVEVAVPQDGSGVARMIAMKNWCGVHKVAVKPSSDGSRDTLSWCFVDAAAAILFEETFTGRIVIPDIDAAVGRFAQHS